MSTLVQDFTSRVFARLPARRGGTVPLDLGPWTPTPPAAAKRVASHLEKQYGIDVTKMSGIDSGWRVDRTDGPSWCARIFPPARPREVVEGDAEILRFLEQHDFPAERLVHDEPISEIDGFHLLVTEWVDGPHQTHGGESERRMGELHGRLHTFPCEGAAARPAGSWHLLSIAGGTRRTDVETVLPLLAEVQRGAPKAQKPHFDTLRAELEAIDLCEDLPHCLIHIDFGGPNVIDNPDRGLVGIDWAGAGSGPRVFGLAHLINGRRDPRLVDHFVAGYREHVELTEDEFARLGPALRVHSLVLEAWGAVFRPQRIADVVGGFDRWRDLTASLAQRTREAFASRGPVEDVPPPAPMEDQFQTLVDAVKGRSDRQIDDFAKAVGGYPNLLALVFDGMRVRLTPDGDCDVGFVLGENLGWVFKSAGGTKTITKRVAKRAGAIVRATPQDFLRFVIRELDWDGAVADARLKVDGDATQVTSMFSGRS